VAEAFAAMKWFRSNIRPMARLAVVALAMQFLLSFGHFHGDSAQAASALADAKRSGLHKVTRLAMHSNAPHKTSSPSNHQPDGQPADDCAICAVMALAGAVVVATPPDLSAPQATAFTYLTAAADFADFNSVRVAFQPRGPPGA
jgi:hypothetical protein